MARPLRIEFAGALYHVHRDDATAASAIDIGTRIQTQGDLTLAAWRDLNARAANVTAEQGNLTVTAGRDLTLTAGQARIQLDEAHRHKGGGFLSKKTRTTRDSLDRTSAQATTLSGNRVTVLADHDLTLTGSNVVSDLGTTLVAQRDLTLEAATNTTLETHFKAEKKTGLGRSGFGLTLGSQKQSTDQQDAATLTAATTVGSTQGNLTLEAGNRYRQSGSDALAPQGDISVNAQRIDIGEARETAHSENATRFKQSGLTLALSSPVISAIQTVDQMRRAAKDTDDPRMQALAATAAGLAGHGAYNQVKAGQGTRINGQDNQIATGKTNPDGTPETRDADLADKVGGVSVSISLGNSKSESHSTQTGDTARAATLAAGHDITLRAKQSSPLAANGEEGGGEGAIQTGDLTVVGSDIKAGRNVSLEADHNITLLAAQNSASQTSTNSSSSNSVGVGFALGGQSNGFTLNLAASRARGNADGSDVNWNNTHVNANNQLTLQSGGDTTLKGAVATGKQITADIGGNLAIESLQDTSTYTSKQSSAGVGLNLCIPPFCYGASSGSVSASKSKANSNYASVAEQSGLRAGDAGFNVSVQGNTDLTGGVIASTQAAIDHNQNTLTTASLTTSDLQNKADASASSSGISLSSDMLTQGKYGIAKGVIGNALNNAGESGDSAGQTRSAVSEGEVTITDEAEQQQRTGKTGQETIASLNRDTAHAQTAAQKQDVEAMQRTVEAEQAIKQQAFKEVTVHTDAAYKAMFRTETKFYKVTCSSTPEDCVKDSKLVHMEEITRDEAKRNGQVLAVNGILNNVPRAGELAYQNVPDDENTGQKPASITLMHIPPASTGLGELFVAGYEKLLAPILDYTNADITYADLIQGRGDAATLSLGHSRGTIVQRNAFNIAADNNYKNEKLSVVGVGGAVGYQDYTSAAARVIQSEQKATKNITFTYMVNDPVPVIAAGNPGDAMAAFKEFFHVLSSDNSAHSCYGTGAAGCTTIANPVPGGPVPTNQNPGLIRVYRGGELVSPLPTVAGGKP